MPVSDIARETVATVSPTAPLRDAVRTMQERNVRSVVATDDGTPVGLLTDRHLATLVLDEAVDPASTTVDQLAGDVTTIDADAGLYDLLTLMSERGVRRVPVVDDGDLVGIVSIDDVVVLLGMELQHVATVLRADGPTYERLATDLGETGR